MDDSIHLSMMPDGLLQVRMDKDMTILELFDALEVSREKEKKLQVLVNGEPFVNKGLVLPARTVYIAQPVPEDVPASFEPVDVVYEDDFCLVADKPPFLLVHDDGSGQDNLQDRINGHLQMEGWPYPAQACHRIDQEASGLVLFCKNPMFQSYFDRQFEDGTAKKEYAVVLDGLMDRRHVDINNPIGRDRHDARKMMAVQTGKKSHTHLEREARRGAKTLAKADISTGRKHQIRVHSASQGWPVYNDPLYGKVYDERGLLLQARKLAFRSPGSEDVVELELPLDRRFREFFQKPRKDRRRR